MKKWAILMMALLIAAGCVSPVRAAETLVYASSFVAGVDGWYARGASSVYRTTEATLRTEGRTSDWHSPGHDFDLVEGAKYELSVEVFQDEADSASFMISIAHSKDGVETYENLARGEAKKGEWVKLSGSYTAGDFDRSVLYVETSGAASLSFEIRDFRVEAPAGVPAPKATEAPMVIEAVDDLPSLKDVFAGKFEFGTALPQQALNNAKVKQLVLEQFNILTPENELKPDAVLDVAESRKLAKEDETAVAVHFNSAKPLLNFALANGLHVHGHVLVWHSQTPEAFFHEGYDVSKPLVGRDVMLARMENYIRQVLTWTEENYPGVIVSWDVVNEAIDDGSNWLRNSNWRKTVGDDFLARAFEYARKYAAEGVLLYYNDYNTAYTGKLNGIVRLLNELIPEGNIDGYGFQMHHTVSQPSQALITAAVEKIAGLGIRLRVSELDVGTGKNTETSLLKQKERYYEIMQLLLRFSDQFEAVQVWGVSDQMSWRRQENPLLFDKNLNPKPAFFGVVEAAE